MRTPSTRNQTLAIDGGAPVRSASLPYGHQYIDEEDIAAVVEVLRSDWLTTGPKVKEFEEAVAAYVGVDYAVAFSSGTAALHAAAFAAGLGPGDEAITTPLTFCATANCVLYMGASPVFADVSEDTLNLDPELVAKRITPKTKAILPVDYTGHPADLEAMLSPAEAHGLTVIEDGAHALGAEYQGRRVGGISHMTMFSFHPVKHVTTGEGGMITTNNPEFARRLRQFGNHGIDPAARERQSRTDGQWNYEMTELGFNYRLPDTACALGMTQLKKLPDNLSRRRDIVRQYNEAFSELPAVITPVERPDVQNSWHIFPIRLEMDRLTAGRKEIFQALRAENIGVQVHYIPVHLQPYYKEKYGYRTGDFPVAEKYYDRALSLPLYPTLTDSEQGKVISLVKKFYA